MEVTRQEPSRAELARLMTSLLQEANDDEADQICRELVEYWVRHSFFEKKDGAASQSQYASSGLILSPELAATCAFGWLRTRRYLLALNQVVSDLLKDRTIGMPLRVLYPGCGPYGILALPLLAIFSSKQLQVHVIDYLTADTLTDEILGEKLNVPQDIDNAYQSFLFTEIILCKGLTSSPR